MHLSPRTIDGYRDDLFEKLNIRSRVGLVLFAIKKRNRAVMKYPLPGSGGFRGFSYISGNYYT
jgi:hypothetical protein